VPRSIIVAKNYVKGWRHSFSASFMLWDVETQQLTPLDPTNATSSDMNPIWSPDGHLVVCLFPFAYVVDIICNSLTLAILSSLGICSGQQRDAHQRYRHATARHCVHRWHSYPAARYPTRTLYREAMAFGNTFDAPDTLSHIP